MPVRKPSPGGGRRWGDGGAALSFLGGEVRDGFVFSMDNYIVRALREESELFALFGRIAGRSAAHYAERHSFSKAVIPEERTISDPPEFFERAAALLDRYFHVLSSRAELETGYRETLALPKCPRRDLIRRIFEDALRVSVPSPG